MHFAEGNFIFLLELPLEGTRALVSLTQKLLKDGCFCTCALKDSEKGRGSRSMAHCKWTGTALALGVGDDGRVASARCGSR